MGESRWQRLDEGVLQGLRATQSDRIKYLDPDLGKFLQKSKNADKHSVSLRSVEVDPYGRLVGRYNHYWNKIRIASAEVIGTLSQDSKTEDIRYNYRMLLEPPDEMAEPKVKANDARKIADDYLGAKSYGANHGFQELVLEPQIEAVVWNDSPLWSTPNTINPGAMKRVLNGWKLVYHFHDLLKTGSTILRVDAQTGKVLSFEDSASASPSTLYGNSKYYSDLGNPISFPGDLSGSTYSLFWGSQYSVHMGDVQNSIYSSNSNSFGDGQEYTLGNPINSPNGQTQAVEVMFGLGKVFSFYWYALGRYHFDGNGQNPVKVSVHNEGCTAGSLARKGTNSWNQTSYWIDFSSRMPNTNNGPTEMSIVAHEWSHLVNYRSAQVGTEGGSLPEAKALNEGFATILSTACRIWFTTSSSSYISNPNPGRWKYDWSFGPQCMGGSPESGVFYGVQCLFWPSKKLDNSPSWFSRTPPGYFVTGHQWSLPLVRTYYFLANGAATISSPHSRDDDNRGKTSPWMPGGFSPIGVDKATRIFYHALTQTVHSGSSLYTIGWELTQAAQSLYGAGSAEHKATERALTATNLGQISPVQLPFEQDRSNASTCPSIPQTEPHVQSVGLLPVGTQAHYYRVIIPPFSTLLMEVNGDLPASGQLTRAAGIEVRTSNGSSLLATAEPVRKVNYTKPGSIGPTVDPFPIDPPVPDNVPYAHAYLEYKNTGNQWKPVLLKIRSAQGRAEALTYASASTMQLREFITLQNGAFEW